MGRDVEKVSSDVRQADKICGDTGAAGIDKAAEKSYGILPKLILIPGLPG